MILCHGLEAIGAIVECAREHRYFITGNVIADIGTVTQRVYFDAVRISLTNQIVDAYTRRTGGLLAWLRFLLLTILIALGLAAQLKST
jgi:hypothetical protein